MNTRWRAFSQSVASSALWLALAGFQAAAQPNAAAKAPKEFVLIEPSAINPKAVAAWKKEGFSGVAVLTEDSIAAKVYRSAAKAVNQAGLELFYWLEVGRSPGLAAEHPEWTASLGTHKDWRN